MIGAPRPCRRRATASHRPSRDRASTRALALALDLLGQLLRAQLADGEELEHAVLHVLEAVVVLVEDAAMRMLEVEVVVGAGVPGQLGDPLEVGADHLRFH